MNMQPQDRAEALLAELAELDMTLARHVHACAIAAEEPKAVGELARSYQRIARSLRQTLALKARLSLERAREIERTAPSGPPPTDWVRVRRRQHALRDAVCRVVWDETEAESADEETFLTALSAALDAGEDEPGFGAQPLDQHVIELCAAMDLPLDKAERWRDLPDLSEARAREPRDGDPDDDDEDDDDELEWRAPLVRRFEAPG